MQPRCECSNNMSHFLKGHMKMMTILVFVEMNGYNADKRDQLYT